MPQCKDTKRSWYPEGFEFITNFSRCVCVVGGIIVKNIIFLHWTYRNFSAFYIFWSRRLWLLHRICFLLCSFAFCGAQNYISVSGFIFSRPLADVTSAVVQSVQTVRLRADCTMHNTNRLLWQRIKCIFHIILLLLCSLFHILRSTKMVV